MYTEITGGTKCWYAGCLSESRAQCDSTYTRCVTEWQRPTGECGGCDTQKQQAAAAVLHVSWLQSRRCWLCFASTCASISAVIVVDKLDDLCHNAVFGPKIGDACTLLLGID